MHSHRSRQSSTCTSAAAAGRSRKGCLLQSSRRPLSTTTQIGAGSPCYLPPIGRRWSPACAAHTARRRSRRAQKRGRTAKCRAWLARQAVRVLVWHCELSRADGSGPHRGPHAACVRVVRGNSAPHAQPEWCTRVPRPGTTVHVGIPMADGR
eukprot:1113873-Prymnesium_polylepis.1